MIRTVKNKVPVHVVGKDVKREWALCIKAHSTDEREFWVSIGMLEGEPGELRSELNRASLRTITPTERAELGI